MARINKSDYDSMKSKSQNMLSLTGQSFTWVSSVISKSRVNYSTGKELHDAMDLAYDNINRGCNSHRSSVYMSDDNGYLSTSNTSHDSPDHGDNSDNSGHRGSNRSSNREDNGSDWSSNRENNTGWNADSVSNADHGYQGCNVVR